MAVDSDAADIVFAETKGVAKAFGHRAQHRHHGRGDFRTDAITGQYDNLSVHVHSRNVQCQGTTQQIPQLVHAFQQTGLREAVSGKEYTRPSGVRSFRARRCPRSMRRPGAASASARRLRRARSAASRSSAHCRSRGRLRTLLESEASAGFSLIAATAAALAWANSP